MNKIYFNAWWWNSNYLFIFNRVLFALYNVFGIKVIIKKDKIFFCYINIKVHIYLGFSLWDNFIYVINIKKKINHSIIDNVLHWQEIKFTLCKVTSRQYDYENVVCIVVPKVFFILHRISHNILNRLDIQSIISVTELNDNINTSYYRLIDIR